MTSEELQEMVESGVGYRCGGHGFTDVRTMLDFEVYDLGNGHVFNDFCKSLNLKIPSCEVDEDTEEFENRYLAEEIEAIYGKSRAIWLGRKVDVKVKYCSPGEEISSVPIPKCAIPISDLHDEGTLFLYPEGCGES